MDRAKKDLERRQQEQEELLAREREKQAAREWWRNPASSSTLTWVHTRGESGTPAGEIRDWDVRVHQSTLVNPANSMVNLENTEEEMELGQDLSLKEIMVMEGDQDHLLDLGQNANPTAEDKSSKDGQ